jgi:GMP synthase-like glutamine amidotransferase
MHCLPGSAEEISKRHSIMWEGYPMVIGILECGSPPINLIPRFGTYAQMMRRMLGPEREYTTFDVTAGELPTTETATAAYVITGSAAGVYDDLPWISALIRFLQKTRRKAKLVGICFGHQIMAEAFGGKAEKSSKGWGVGLQRYDVMAAAARWMDDVAFVDAPASHQDQVVACPTDARVIASSNFTPYAGLNYGDAISFQFHPEFSPAYAKALIEARRDRLGSLAELALASYTQQNDCALLARWIGCFLGNDHDRRK